MKRAAFLVIIMFSVFLSAFSQKPECIFCGNNVLVETSSAIGDLNENFGAYSLTIGNNNKIAENLQLVTLIGSNNIANGNLIGNYSGAFGINNLIQSDSSYIIGKDDTVSATMAIAIGNRSKVSGRFSVAIGRDIKVSGFGSVGIGINSKVSGNFSAAVGNNSYANATNSYSFGNNVWSDAYGSITIGTSPIFLKNTTPNSLIIGFNSSVPTLFVGSSDGSGTSGKVGIGNVTSPTAKLHIRADAADSATLRLEHGIGKVSRIYFCNTDDYYLQAANNQNMIFRTPSGKDFSFENGNVGIGTSDPQSKLHVVGSLIVGENNIANGIYSFAGGSNSQATGNYSFAFGEGAISTGNNTIALGKQASALGIESFAFGWQAEALGNASFSIGPYSKTSENALLSIAIGSKVTAEEERCMTFGFGLHESPLTNNVMNSLMIGFNSNLPTFFVGPSSGSGKTGRIGIGNMTNPQAKLHILADENEAADLKLEYSATGNNQLARIYLGNHRIEAGISHMYFYTSGNSSHFVFQNGSIRSIEGTEALPAYSFTGSPNTGMFRPSSNIIAFSTGGQEKLRISPGGNVGIGTSQPEAKLQVKDGDIFIEDIDRGIIMKSPDGNCWRGTLDNTGSLHFVQVNCDDLQTGLEKPQAGNQPRVRIYPNPAGDKVFVSISPQLSGVTLRITDVSGKLLHTERLTNPESYIDMTSHKSGMYVFSITGSNGDIIETMKVMKE